MNVQQIPHTPWILSCFQFLEENGPADTDGIPHLLISFSGSCLAYKFDSVSHLWTAVCRPTGQSQHAYFNLSLCLHWKERNVRGSFPCVH